MEVTVYDRFYRRKQNWDLLIFNDLVLIRFYTLTLDISVYGESFALSLE